MFTQNNALIECSWAHWAGVRFFTFKQMTKEKNHLNLNIHDILFYLIRCIDFHYLYEYVHVYEACHHLQMPSSRIDNHTVAHLFRKEGQRKLFPHISYFRGEKKKNKICNCTCVYSHMNLL